MIELSQLSCDFARSERRTAHLLLVEDDETDVLFVKRCLAKYGADIPLTIARDGAEALEILRSRENASHTHVILTDLNMPGVSGHELIEAIRADAALANSVIFVLSSSRLTGDIRRCYGFNIAGYLTKQRPPRELEKDIMMIFDYCTSVHLPA